VPEDKVEEFKEKIYIETNIPKDSMILSFAKNPLEDGRTLASYHIFDEFTTILLNTGIPIYIK